MIAEKDWGRMSDLVLSGKDGAGTAKIIKDKGKAISRFVAGLKLDDEDLRYNSSWKEFCGPWSEFGNKALELGATVEEIRKLLDEAVVPHKYSEKLIKLAGKKLNNRFVGDISRKILGAGYDIKYLPHNGYAITIPGKDAMARNGRKWTIGYKTEIDFGDEKVNLIFDAITDEGDGPTSYIIDNGNSSGLFRNLMGWESVGKQKFISMIMESLAKYEKIRS